MRNIYQQMLERGSNTVLKASHTDLNDLSFYDKVFNSSKVSLPKLDLERTRVEIKEEQISYRNAPPNISFSISGNTNIEYAIYKIPIVGDIELFGSLVGRHIDRQTTYVEYQTLCYKEYSNIPITNNDGLIDAIKARFLSFTNKINNELNQFDQELTDFYNTTFEPNVRGLIETEISKRNLNSSSASKLNPFA
jgi:hypothetical protein